MKVLENLSNLVGNPLEWRSASKALLLQGLSLLLHVQYTLMGHYLLSLEDRERWVNVANLEVLLGHFHVLIGLSIFILGAMLVLYRHPRFSDKNWFEFFAAMYYGLSLCYFSYTIGTMTLPTGAVLAGAPVVGFILFNRMAVMVALSASLLAIIGMSYASALGIIPYAPTVPNAQIVGSDLSVFWTTMMYIFAAPPIAIMTLLSYYLLRRWREREDEVRLLSMTDPLTGVSNRRSILSHLHREQERSRQFGPGLSVLMLDMDHFKRINDTWGHPVGDRVLVEAAKVLKETIRQNDMVGRFGGEEFLIVLPGTDLEGARMLAERCRERIHSLKFEMADGSTLYLTASIGLYCNADNRNISVDEMLRLADDALYLAKRNGRNQLVVNDGTLSITDGTLPTDPLPSGSGV